MYPLDRLVAAAAAVAVTFFPRVRTIIAQYMNTKKRRTLARSKLAFGNVSRVWRCRACMVRSERVFGARVVATRSTCRFKMPPTKCVRRLLYATLLLMVLLLLRVLVPRCEWCVRVLVCVWWYIQRRWPLVVSDQVHSAKMICTCDPYHHRSAASRSNFSSITTHIVFVIANGSFARIRCSPGMVGRTRRIPRPSERESSVIVIAVVRSYLGVPAAEPPKVCVCIKHRSHVRTRAR